MAEIHFELHTLEGGKWRKVGEFPEKSLAMEEAGRLGRSNRISDVKVYQIDNGANRLKQKLVHHENRTDRFDDLIPGGKIRQAPEKLKSERAKVFYSVFVLLIVLAVFTLLYLRS